MSVESSRPSSAPEPPHRDPVADADLDPRSPVPARPGPVQALANVVRGGLIGMAELVPGVSGGTVALVTGVYPRLLDSGAHVVDGVRSAVLGSDRRARTAAAFRHVDWWLLLPLAVGMLAMVFTMAGVMKGFVEGSPEIARGLFLGMVAASIAVPLGMARATRGGRTWVLGLIFVAGAAFAFGLSGLPSGTISDPSYLLVFVAAAVAICALVLPGVSGSYLLLAMGLYAPTLGAVEDRNFAYLGVFALGALVGISLFVKVLDRLLEDFRKPTLVAMAGLMLGSLRALWPWQTEEADVLAPGSDWPVVLAAVAAGVVVVILVLVLERVFADRSDTTDPQDSPVERQL
ncbi:DUF368 domain-containing protein [Rhodococcus sp. IEGM 1408]|uniref:DUF368 domain-containing protein n=1 Tax=Rhodococcus sp. IEGM 1408 TaxID=3082220 RepID=UPI0029541692|nr:DUF368 domain-containing protein [Rhodococcus sp. IEGM 1408]MDV8001695.1 DUF368 domain-containing protein [Rhodococcus sp. IEGM 1408]